MGTGASRTVFAPVSRQKARISFDLHGCVTWMSMPRTALEPLDSSWQPARFVVLDDRRLQVNRVDHRSFAGYSLHNLGSGQQVAAGARWRGDAPPIRSAIELCCSGGATMCLHLLRSHPCSHFFFPIPTFVHEVRQRDALVQISTWPRRARRAVGSTRDP